MEGTTFGNVPLNCEVKLEVWDPPNSAGVVIDAVRCARLALDRGIGGSLTAPSSYFMKSSPLQYTNDEARQLTEAFIKDTDLPKIKPRKTAKPEKLNVALRIHPATGAKKQP
jgi:myo-inositol-1-phosphate synthase